MNIIACALALFILINVGDRLRLVNWHTAKPRVVALLLLEFGIGAAGLYQGVTAIVHWYVWLAMMAALIMLHITRNAWRHGVPPDARTDHGKFDAEVQR